MDNISAHQNLKSALQASQIWWADMGIEIPTLPPAPKKRKGAPPQHSQALGKTSSPTQEFGQSSAPTKKILPPPVRPETPERASLKEQIAKATALANAAPTLEALKTVLTDFDAGLLSDHAQKMVFARGNPQAKLMIIGEAPGKVEDRDGAPFIGDAGQLLDKMFAAIAHKEDDLYITNACNWRPPHDRAPSDDELALCKPFIERHIALIAPEIIVIVGGVALQALTGKTSIMKNRGQWNDLNIEGRTIPTMTLYHPNMLLAKPELKKFAWRDLLAVKARLETPK